MRPRTRSGFFKCRAKVSSEAECRFCQQPRENGQTSIWISFREQTDFVQQAYRFFLASIRMAERQEDTGLISSKLVVLVVECAGRRHARLGARAQQGLRGFFLHLHRQRQLLQLDLVGRPAKKTVSKMQGSKR
eukprot:6189204-Pleurochrysis_carterae.AAC.1